MKLILTNLPMQMVADMALLVIIMLVLNPPT